ncbi:hypothetical protein AK812_SmicGene27775 [Symbiodinium microadriaticum]|uniref:Uncharacterized protein n=1 Tax=Symbiodinium microadriaticum TaxID=2951 RepID=A0A1Q9D677_SYMMI|nr:hypothetical protein AK812_SmicGene27775 [Symbiodinium microadriaticum]
MIVGRTSPHCSKRKKCSEADDERMALICRCGTEFSTTANEVMFTVRERILKASEQIQFLASLSKVEAGKAQREWELAAQRKAMAVLIAWAFPELLAEVMNAHQKSEVPGNWDDRKYYKLVSGDEVFVDTKAVWVTTVVSSFLSVFWAMPADFQLLADYGIDASAVEYLGVREKLGLKFDLILSRRGSDEEGAKPELVNYMGATPTEFPTRDACGLSAQAAAELAEVSCALAIAGARGPEERPETPNKVYDEECFTVLGDELHPRLEEHREWLNGQHKAWSTLSQKPGDFRGFAANEFYDHLAPLLLERINDIHPVCCVYFMWSFCKPLILCTVASSAASGEDLFEAVAQKVVPEATRTKHPWQ